MEKVNAKKMEKVSAKEMEKVNTKKMYFSNIQRSPFRQLQSNSPSQSPFQMANKRKKKKCFQPSSSTNCAEMKTSQLLHLPMVIKSISSTLRTAQVRIRLIQMMSSTEEK